MVVALILTFGLSFGWSSARIGAQEKNTYMLAVIAADGNVVVYDADGKNPQSLTTDAVANVRLYQWPTWSTDGRLAFFGASVDPRDPYSLAMFVARDPSQALTYKRAYFSLDEAYTYSYWSTGDCGSGDCRDLALLYTPSGVSGLAVRMIRDDAGDFSHNYVDRAAPFYYSFSPDGRQMIWHRFNSRVELYDVEQNTVISALPDAPGQFASPMWSPVDDRLLFATQSDDPSLTNLVIAQGTERTVIATGLSGVVYFAWSPDSSKVVYMAGTGKLAVIDAQTGAEITKAPHGNIIAQFWSPQGDKVAYLRLNRDLPGLQTHYRPNGHTAGISLQQPTITWFVLDVATGQATSVADFFPSQDMIYYLNFFDQFSRSHRLWSPDGCYLVYATADSDGKNRVMLAEVANPGNATMVAEGSLGIWSWQ
jgi:Tol biopolymer transport system component